MAEPFLGEIKIISFNFAPKGWALCNGQFLPINQNQALFSILGTQFGGDGRTTFALPDLRGRVPVHINPYIVGQRGGEEFHTVSLSEMPQHIHTPVASSNAAGINTATNNFWAGAAQQVFSSTQNNVMQQSVLPVGGSQPHENRSPYLVLNFAIALQGIFPSRN